MSDEDEYNSHSNDRTEFEAPIEGYTLHSWNELTVEEKRELNIMIKDSMKKSVVLKPNTMLAVIAMAKFTVNVSNLIGAAEGISLPPGYRLAAILKFVLPKKAFERVFAQAINDMREEYFDALAEGRTWLARWRRIQLSLVLIFTLACWGTASIGQKLVEMWKLGG